jgi:integrase
VSLFKRGNVYWSYVYVDGVRHHKSTGTGNRREAEAEDLKFKQELIEKQSRPRPLHPEMTFAELAARFLADGEVKPHHAGRLQFLLPYFGETAIGRIDKPRVRDYRKARRAQKPVSDTTVNRDLEVLRHLLYFAVDEGLIAANPLNRLHLIKERRKKRPVMSLEEEQKLLISAAPHLKAIMIAALDTGMRRGEILKQRWEDVDFSRRLLFVTQSKTAEGESREIPLTGRLFALLSAERQETGIVFTFSKKKRPVLAIKTAWKAAIRRAGIPYYRFHDLRHTFNTRLMEAGVMQEIRKALMGHSSGEDVNSIYTHVELPAKRQAIARMEEWVKQRTEQQIKGGEPQNGTEPKGSVPAPVAEFLPAGADRHPATDATES